MFFGKHFVHCLVNNVHIGSVVYSQIFNNICLLLYLNELFLKVFISPQWCEGNSLDFTYLLTEFLPALVDFW